MTNLPVLNCDGCGACCLEQESPPMYALFAANPELTADIDPDDFDLKTYRAMPPSLRKGIEDYVKHMQSVGIHPNNLVCIWFDEETRKCKHYEYRPSICRDNLQPGDEECLAWRETYKHTL